MHHYGDITKINGHEVPIVDIVTGGSPCQDLSVAGKRAGLDGERSGLFMEQIRVIKEMRDECARQLRLRGADEPIRPRFMVWENVPGAFSSNKGEDFRCVLEETARIVDKAAVIPRPKDKWTPSGCILGNGWSIAWRVHDAQFWGVPQRRKRISLVADFGGESAPEILFEREGVPGDSEQSGEERQTITRSSEGNLNPASYTLKIRGGCERDSNGKKAGKGALIQTELSGTLGVSQDQTLITKCLNPWDVQSKHIQPTDGKAEALYSGECRYGGGESYVMDVCSGVDSYNLTTTGGVSKTVQAERSDNEHIPCVVYGVDAYNQPQAVCVGNGQLNQMSMSEQANTLDTMHDQQAVMVHTEPILLESNQNHATVQTDGISTALPASMGMGGGYVPMITYGLDRASFNQGKNAQFDFKVEEETAQTLVSRGPGGVLARRQSNELLGE